MVTTPAAMQALKARGYKRLRVQYGAGKDPVMEEGRSTRSSFAVDFYRYKDSLRQDMEEASLIISHAGNIWSSGFGTRDALHLWFDRTLDYGGYRCWLGHGVPDIEETFGGSGKYSPDGRSPEGTG